MIPDFTDLLFFHYLQSQKDQAEMKELRETVEQQGKTIKRFNRGESQHSRNTVTEVQTSDTTNSFNENEF